MPTTDFQMACGGHITGRDKGSKILKDICIQFSVLSALLEV